MEGFSRRDRVAQLIMRELAQIIQRDLSDPRIDMITVSHVNVSSDMKHAKVFVSQLVDTYSERNQDKVTTCLQVLNHAAGFLRRHLAMRVALRTIPALRFHYDGALDDGCRINEIITMANQSLPKK